MTGMAGGLHKGPPSCEGGLRMVLIVGMRIGGPFVAVFRGLFGASHPENQRFGAVNSFSPGPLWVLGSGIRPDPGPEDLPPQDTEHTVQG